MQADIVAHDLEPGDVFLNENGTRYVVEKVRRIKGVIAVDATRESDANEAFMSFRPDEMVVLETRDYEDVYDLPARRGVVNYTVPVNTWVMVGDKVYGSPGDHIHGIKDAAGPQLTVYDGATCPVCGPMNQAEARRYAKEISDRGIHIAVACTRAAARGQFDTGDREWGIMVSGKWYGTKADFQADMNR